MDLIIKMLCDILFDVGQTAGTSHRLPANVKVNLLCADITCFHCNNCDTDYRYGKMCAGYACCKYTARHS